MPQAHGRPPSQLLPGAWLAQSSLGTRGWGQGAALPFSREATEECLHAKQNVTPTPSHCMASAHPAPVRSAPTSRKPLS